MSYVLGINFSMIGSGRHFTTNSVDRPETVLPNWLRLVLNGRCVNEITGKFEGCALNGGLPDDTKYSVAWKGTNDQNLVGFGNGNPVFVDEIPSGHVTCSNLLIIDA